MLEMIEVIKSLKLNKRDTPNRISNIEKITKAVSFDKNISTKSGKNPIQFEGVIKDTVAT